ncbi:MAG TPA: bifunctional phosphoglucose/phosphomannose isomerase [Anaerolineales bacterium]|nr:bifunctional phosphoglucose/phosphomannose isomerase [Anaerolineales bacterium]
MDLDNLELMREIDTQNMLGQIQNLPEQLSSAWKSGLSLPVPNLEGFNQVLITGMGGSAIGGELLRAYALNESPIPIYVHRDYGLPGFAKGRKTLVIASSHSGNTEETLDAVREAIARNCQVFAITTGGMLNALGREAGFPIWLFEHNHQPRSAVGYSFGLLLALFYRLGLVSDQVEFVAEAAREMENLAAEISPSVPSMKNAAKRYAGQMVGRWVTVFGSGILAPVAARWKGQINENANAPANYEILPEADHNTLAGIQNPAIEILGNKTYSMFLACPSDHPRNRLRQEITRQTFMLEGLSTDLYMSRGKSNLAQMWTAILFGDYASYYLAAAYKTDPTLIEPLLNLKETLANFK